MQLRKMLASDVEAAACLEASIFSEPWSSASFLGAVENQDAYYLVVEENGEIIAQCGYYNLCGEGEILNVAVCQDARRRGIARKMLQTLISYGYQNGVSSYTLEVRAGNAAAIGLYKSLGFQTMGIRPDFYEHPKEDAVIMNLEPNCKQSDGEIIEK